MTFEPFSGVLSSNRLPPSYDAVSSKLAPLVNFLYKDQRLMNIVRT